MPYSDDVKVQRSQREKLAIMSFLAGLGSRFETAKFHILSDPQISTLHEVFARVLCAETTSSTSTPVPSALVGCNGTSASTKLTNQGYTR